MAGRDVGWFAYAPLTDESPFVTVHKPVPGSASLHPVEGVRVPATTDADRRGVGWLVDVDEG